MRSWFLLLLTFITFHAFADFEDYFLEKTLRVDYYHSGTNTEEFYSIDEIIEEPFWGGSQKNLIDTFDYGNYKYHVIDKKSQKLIYSKGYNTLFNEWKTTEEAKTTRRSFSETVTIPFPKKPVIIEFYARDRKNIWHKKFEYTIDPESFLIHKEQKQKYPSFNVRNNGKPSENVDIVIIPDGYTKTEMTKFKKDCEAFAEHLLGASPFKQHAGNFNIWGIEAISENSGTDIPGEDIWKTTVVNTSFYTFGDERYLTTTDNKSVRNVASNAPYDHIFILVNTDKYGGGGIYNFYSVVAAHHFLYSFLIIHEFGHAFAGLADEYYTSEVSLENYHPLDIEPWEPNITTLVDFDSKWKHMVKKGTDIPTEVCNDNLRKVGVYEGAGYVAKGVYRPYIDCSMKSVKYDAFCPVCSLAIDRMIRFQAGKP